MDRSAALALPVALLVVACADATDAIHVSPGPPMSDPVEQPIPDQEVTISDVRPPPISGGTMVVSRDGAYAIASDPDRDRIVVVRLEDGFFEVQLPLQAGDEPGRLAEGTSGRVHVLLRRGGAVATIDLASMTLLARRPICAAPRGIAYDAAADRLHIACAGGELVTTGTDPSLPEIRRLRLDRDLRDVVVAGDTLLVSRFRSADILAVGPDGQIAGRVGLPRYTNPQTAREYGAAVAWRMVPHPQGGAAIVHQRSQIAPIPTGDPAAPPSYGSMDCNGAIVTAAVSVLRPGESGSLPIPPAHSVGGVGALVLPVDVAVSPDGDRVAVAAAGSFVVVETTTAAVEEHDGCAEPSPETRGIPAEQEPIALAYHGSGDLLVQTREPSTIARHSSLTALPLWAVGLGGPSRRDSGHALFHNNPDGQAAIACASCHPEGQDDGRVYDFAPGGARRSQSLAGGVLDTVPLHWDGEMRDLGEIMDTVFVDRMAGQPQGEGRIAALASWLDGVPRLPPNEATDPGAAARGQELFQDADVGCAACHAGPKLTNGSTVDVGTGRPFQVPSLLGVAARAPFLHDGCAPTLADRFGAECGGGDLHGHTSQLSAQDIADLVVYLETL